MTDGVLLRIRFRTQGPLLIEILSLRVIGSRAGGDVVAGRVFSYRLDEHVNGGTGSFRTRDGGAPGKRQGADDRNQQEESMVGMGIKK